MISKKILALVLAISVIVCALPAFSVSAADVWPEVEETLSNPTVWYDQGFYISLDNASDGLKACNSQGIPNTHGMKVSGTVTIGSETINLNNYTIRNGSQSNNTVAGWGSDFICHDPDFKARLAASDAPGLERDEDGNVIIASSGDDATVCMRNFVRYILYCQDEDYSALTDDELKAKSLAATAESITFAPYKAEMLKAYPEGTLYLPTTTDYVKHGLTDDFVKSNSMYIPAAAGIGVGPYGIYEVKDAGTYDVWLLKRDQAQETYQRDIYLDINGKTFTYTGIEGAPASVNDGYYMAPEDNGQELTVKAGDKVFIQINNQTKAYSGCYGILLVPSDKVDGATITGNFHDSSVALAAYLDLVNNGYVKYITPAADTINVTIGDAEVEVTEGAARAWYPDLSYVDSNGQYIDYVTLLDVIIAAAEAKVEMPIEMVQELTSDKVTPITYDTTVASGNPWPTNTNGNGYNHLWAGTEIFCTNSSTAYETTVTAPKAGNYYLFTWAYTYTNRWLSFTVNGADVYEAEGDTQFYNNNENSKTVVVAQVPVALNEGQNTVTIKANGGWVRCSYVGFIEADSYDDAVATAAEITASKAAFNNYFAMKGNIYVGGKVSNFDGGFTINGEGCANSDLEYIAIEDGAEIGFIDSFDATNFFPVKAAMSGSFYGGRWSTDHMYNDTTDYDSKFISSATFPFDAHSYDALAGCYINGYVTITADLVGQESGGQAAYDTTGDDTVSKVFIRDLPIRHAKGNGSTIHLGINRTDAERWGMGADITIKYADLDGDGVDESYAVNIKSGTGALYDTSNLYITNSQSKAPAVVTATDMGNGVYQLTCNKSVPVCLVKVTKADGVVTETTIVNDVIDFMDKDGIEITVAEGQTVYVWEGTALPVGSMMAPLCAPISR